MKSLILVVTALVLCASNAFAGNLVSEAKQGVLMNVSDPEATKFRNVKVHHDTSGGVTVCGEFNTTNQHGGKTGYTRFVSISGLPAILGQRFDEWQPMWEKYCH